jgi:hypothetical protein
MSDQLVLRDALRRAASALKAHDLPFALGGSYALWVHGAPEPVHDVDFVIAQNDADVAAEVLAASGFDVERPPEDWIVKARHRGATVDLLHQQNGVPVDVTQLNEAVVMEVLGLNVPVLPAHHVVRVKLLALTERYCDFAAVLPFVRAVREQIDWTALKIETGQNPYAAAFVYLAELLGLTGGSGG